MSETQKLIASFTGAFVAHLLLLIAVFLLLATRGISSSVRESETPAEQAPTEISILLADLLDEVEVEEPEPLLPPTAPQPFFNTDSNTPEADVPPEARFQSDRNTTGATEIAPDPDQPQVYGPTTRGDAPLDYLELQEQDYIDGELNEPPASAAAGSTGLVENPATQAADATPATEPQDGEDEETVAGAADSPPEAIGDRVIRPDGSVETAEEAEEMSQRSFVDSNSTSGAFAGDLDDDRDAKAEESEEEADEIGEASDPIQEKTAETKPPQPENSAEIADEMKPADEGLFANGFTPQDRQSMVNGSLTRVGQNAVDAEETELGKYQAKVRRAISRTWNRYRQDNDDFVTWGIVKIQFHIDKNGRVHDLKITENNANTVLAEFSVKAILDSDLPAMPEDVADSVGSEGLEIKYDIIIY